MEETSEKKPRQRRPKSSPVQFPVEASILMPGQKSPRLVSALWVRRDATGITLGLPELERPYMTRTLHIPDSSGAVVELVEMTYQQPAQPQQGWQQPAPSVPPARPDVLRQNGDMAPRPLRSAVGPAGPVSEVRDENGIPTVVSAAFGMPLPT